jgi:lysine/ornithine N-monooxygenase
MEKTEVIETLNKAIVSHKAWVINAQALIDGVPLDKEKVPVNATECEFGKWYYGDGQRLKNLPGFKDIETPHDKLHETYMEIFTLLYGEESKKPSFFSRIMGKAQKAAAEKREAAKEKSLLLKDHSTEVIDQLEHVQRVINAIGEKQLSGYLT